MTTKTHTDWKREMSQQYDEVKAGQIDLKLAAELSNICGKWMKADSLELGWAQFFDKSPKRPEAADAAE